MTVTGCHGDGCLEQSGVERPIDPGIGVDTGVLSNVRAAAGALPSHESYAR